MRDAVGALLGAVLPAANLGGYGASRGAGWAARVRALLLRALLPLLAFGAALRHLARTRAFLRKIVGPGLGKERLRALEDAAQGRRVAAVAAIWGENAEEYILGAATLGESLP